MQIKKMTVKFSHKHVQRQTGHIIRCPTAVWDCTGQAQSHQALTTPAQSHNLCLWLYVRYGPATVMIQWYVGPPVTCRCSCRCSWISQPGHHVAGWPGGPQLPFFSATGMPQRLPLPIYPPLLSSCDLLTRHLWPFSPSPSPPFTLPLPCLLLLPQLALSLLLLLLPLFIGFPLWVGSLRIRRLLNFQVLVPQEPRAGAAALSAWLGKARPASQALPDTGPPATRQCVAPPKTLGTRPPRPPPWRWGPRALGP